MMPWGEIFLIFHILVVVVLMVRVLYCQHDIGISVAWLVILFAFPLVGAVAYVLIGEPRLGRDRLRRQTDMNRYFRQFSQTYLVDINENASYDLDERYHGISLIASNSSGLVAIQGNHVQLLITDDAILEAMADDIRKASESCLMAFYIIDVKGKVGLLMDEVLAAARRGVVCSILADSVGSASFWRSEWPQKLRSAGISVTRALPVGFWRTFFVRADLRNHRKILVVDQKVGYTGSYNLVDPKFFKKNAGVGEWVDAMVRCEGGIVQALAAIFAVDIAVETDSNMHRVQQWMDEYGKEVHENNVQAVKSDHSGIIAQVIPSAPEPGQHSIYSTIICALHAATRRIIITTPYFVPDSSLLLALTTAAARGVDVTLIVPESVDSKLVKYASRAYYPLLLDAGVKIALFSGGLLHTKTLTVDDDYTLFGTVNMDMRSFYLNLEVCLALYDEETTREIVNLQYDYLKQCTYIEKKAWQQRGKWWVLVENTVRLFSPLL